MTAIEEPPVTVDRRPEKASASSLSPSEILDALLEDPQALIKVRAMPSVLLHRTITGIGLQDSAELLAMATPQQVRELLDLELWQGDRIRLEDALDWIHFLTTLPEEVRARDLAALDVELTGYVLRRHLRIYLTAEDELPELPEGVLYSTPDGWFTLEILAGHETTSERIQELIDAMYVDDADATRRLLQNLMWELPSELEEYALRWRNSRLQDLGFADPHESLLVYAYLDPASVSPEERTIDRPLASDPEPVQTTELAQIVPRTDSFWAAAMDRIASEAERHRLAQALLYLGNRCLAADRIAPADPEGVRTSIDDLHGRLGLGLEYLAGGDLSRAVEVLAGVALLRIARVGFSLPLDRRRRVMPLVRQGRLGPAPGSIGWIDPPLLDQIRGLIAGRPRFHDLDLGDSRPFARVEDLRVADGWIDHLLAAVAISEGLVAEPELQARDATFGDRFRTILVNGLLGRRGPIDAAALARFVSELVVEERLDRRVTEAALAAVQPGTAPASVEVIESWVVGLQASVGRLQVEGLDLRFVDGLILAS
jgi:hypothetical protein